MPININELNYIIEECERFIRLSQIAADRLREGSNLYFTGCKETGAVRRASMDLTRALEEMRKSK